MSEQRRDWLAGSNPKWHPLVLAVLQRDHPQIADEVWSRAIDENAARAMALVPDWMPDKPDDFDYSDEEN